MVAVRTDDGALKVASGLEAGTPVDVRNRFVRGPARVAEVFALLPEVRRKLPEARLPFQRPGVLGAMAGSMVAIQAVRRTRFSSLTQESLSALLALGPRSSRSGARRAEYHGAEHISIGSYEHGEPRTREHERCGSHMVGPLSPPPRWAARLRPRPAPPPTRRAARRGLGPVAAAAEVFSWMVANERHPVARALARPATTPQRLVHGRALAGAARGRERGSGRVRPPRIGPRWPSRRGNGAFPSTSGPPGREDAGGLLHGRLLQLRP